MQGSGPWFVVSLGKLITAMRECKTLHRAAGMPLLPYLLHPDQRLRLEPQQSVARVWPRDVSIKGFVDHIRSKHDAMQCQAIEMAATHLVLEQERAGAGAGGQVFLPFTLIQVRRRGRVQAW